MKMSTVYDRWAKRVLVLSFSFLVAYTIAIIFAQNPDDHAIWAILSVSCGNVAAILSLRRDAFARKEQSLRYESEFL